MDAILTHFQENARTYIILAVCALPLIIVTRKYSVPLIMYIVEYSIYLLGMHTIVYVVVNVAKWFKANSSMKALRPDGTPAEVETWNVPYFEFWQTELYDPKGLWMFEAVVAVLILGAMWRYRPMKVQTKRVRRYNDTGKKRMDFSKYNPKAKRNAP